MAGVEVVHIWGIFIGMVFIDAEFCIVEWLVPAENELLGCY